MSEGNVRFDCREKVSRRWDRLVQAGSRWTGRHFSRTKTKRIKIQRKYRYAQGQLRGRIEKKERKKAGGKVSLLGTTYLELLSLNDQHKKIGFNDSDSWAVSDTEVALERLDWHRFIRDKRPVGGNIERYQSQKYSRVEAGTHCFNLSRRDAQLKWHDNKGRKFVVNS